MANTKAAPSGNPYLLLYNGILAVGWLYVLYAAVVVTLAGWGPAKVYQVVQLPLKIVQTAALLEIVHAATGLVRAPVFTTLMQVGSRIWVLWGVVNLASRATTTQSLELFHVGQHAVQLNFMTLVVAWSLSEVVRYSFFAVKEAQGSMPFPWLLWARYSAFLPLYPLGTASELTMVWLALSTLKRERPWSIAMPNAFNFGFDYFWTCMLIVVAYVPGLPHMYFYMLKQRGKMLGQSRKQD